MQPSRGPVADEQHLALVDQEFLNGPREAVHAPREEHDLFDVVPLGECASIQGLKAELATLPGRSARHKVEVVVVVRQEAEGVSQQARHSLALPEVDVGHGQHEVELSAPALAVIDRLLGASTGSTISCEHERRDADQIPETVGDPPQHGRFKAVELDGDFVTIARPDVDPKGISRRSRPGCATTKHPHGLVGASHAAPRRSSSRIFFIA